MSEIENVEAPTKSKLTKKVKYFEFTHGTMSVPLKSDPSSMFYLREGNVYSSEDMDQTIMSYAKLKTIKKYQRPEVYKDRGGSIHNERGETITIDDNLYPVLKYKNKDKTETHVVMEKINGIPHSLKPIVREISEDVYKSRMEEYYSAKAPLTPHRPWLG